MNKVAEDYQNTINNLKDAKTQQDNGNNEKMEEELNKVNNKLDEIKNKISSWFNSNK
ncbi:hypothetical protein [Staphylococcus aureus]|uniref:hypothetical protein n=1 Tax=Staphylococcus aureus TaxID=1280 RepID=UPI0013B067C5|nr:hypothetical protein [Staphylococcus aureus]